MKTTKEQRATYRALFSESQSPLASFVKQMIDGLEAAEAEIARLKRYVAVMDAALKIEDKPLQPQESESE